ncbi:AzlD domain-containing protein [Ammoniphilus sp. CFH 90114]|uniref:AzlD domain-containing protein n=1 Tax=Ammoniphilus sp. CFH 90114 TaxID=2493665 RepID=UPI00100DB177|nr:AzlD domain-containing protein [Ammoniphilus sp. CFH 90114]RXT04264.1 AzlD domain-containing protein [Ammoniphilus sp. CFH 90114]
MSSEFFWMILGMGLVTYLTRAPFLLFGARSGLSPRIHRALSYAPLGVFASLAIPPLLIPESGQTWDPAYLFGAAGAAFMGWKTRQPFWAMVGGVVVVAGWRLL